MSAEPEVETLRARVRELMGRAREDLATFVGFPSIADFGTYGRESCDAAAESVLDAFAELGLTMGARAMPDGTLAVIGSAAGPPGSPTVLLYSHYDVQPPGDEAAWLSPPWELTERDGRWFGRGAADSKGNIVLHLTALRALGSPLPCTVKVVIEGSEEQPTVGLETFVPAHPEVLEADAILLADIGNVGVGEPSITTALRGSAFVIVTVRTLRAPVHSGAFGGAAPDALAALVRMLGTLWDADGVATIRGLEAVSDWSGSGYDEARMRADAGVLEGVELVGRAPIADRVWARPSLTVLGMDVPPIAGSLPAIPHEASARLNLRVPPGMDAEAARERLIEHLSEAVPWNAQVEFEREALSDPFAARSGSPALGLFTRALADAYGSEPAEVGQGGSIPACSVFQQVYPDAGIVLLGVAEPASMIHSPNESVDPSEIENLALAEALFLQRFASALSART